MAGRKEMLMRLRGGERGESGAGCQPGQAWDTDRVRERREERERGDDQRKIKLKTHTRKKKTHKKNRVFFCVCVCVENPRLSSAAMFLISQHQMI